MIKKKLALYLVMVLIFMSIPYYVNAEGVNPPNWINSQPTLDSVDTTSATFQVKFDEAVTVYYVITSSSGSEPTSTQVRNGEDSGDGQLVLAGSQAGIAADTYSFVGVSNLGDGVTYNAYLIGEDSTFDISVVGSVSGFTTTPDPPSFSSTPYIDTINIDGVLAYAQMDQTGKVYYSILTDIVDIGPTNIINGDAAIVHGFVDITTINSDHEISVSGLDAYSNYYLCLAGVDDNGNEMSSMWSTTFTTLGNKILGIQYDNGILATTTDDVFIVSFDHTVTNHGGDSDYAVSFDTECGGVYATQDIVLTPTTDYTVGSDNDNTVKIALTSVGLAQIDEVAELDNGAIRVDITNPAGLSPVVDPEEGYLYEAPIDNSMIQEADGVAILTSAAYDMNSTSDLSDDKLLLTFDQDITNVGTVSDYTITLDDGAGDNYGTADVTFGTGDFTVGDGSGNTVEIDFTSQGQVLYEDSTDAIFWIEVTNYSNLTPQIDSANKSIDADIPNRESRLLDLKVDGSTLDGFSYDQYTYDAYLKYDDYNNSDGVFDAYVTPTLKDNVASFVQRNSGGVHTVTVTAEDGLTTSDYVITFNMDYYEIDGYLDGVKIEDPGNDTDTVTKTLSRGTSTVPELTITASHPDASVDISGSGSLPGSYTYTIVVSVTDIGTKTYTLILNAASASSGSSNDNDDNDSSSSSDDTETESTVSDIEDVVDTTDSTTVVDDLSELIEDTTTQLDDITTKEDVETAINNSVQTLELIKAIDPSETGKEEIETLIQKDAENLEKVLEKTEDPNVKTEAVTDYLENLEEVHTETELKHSTELDNTVEDLVERVVEAIGKVQVEKTFEVVDEKASMDVTPDDITDQVESALEQAKKLETAYNNYFENTGIRTFEKIVTLKVEEPEGVDVVEVVMKPEVLAYLKEKGVDSTGVEVGSAGLSFNQKSELFKSEEDLSFQFDFKEEGNSVSEVPTGGKDGSEPPDGYIDVNVVKGNEPANEYEKPVKLKLDVESFVDVTDDTPTNRLTVYRFDEEKQEWEPVGGKYDPVTKTITVNRMHLSKYTVMQSAKSFNDVDQSWAKEEINELLGKGIIDESETFNAESNMTRGELVSWVSKSYGLQEAGVDCDFDDVDPSDPHYDEIACALKQGIIAGKGDGKFDPDGYVTNEEMAKIIGNAMVNFDNKERNSNLQTKVSEYLNTGEVSEWAVDDVALVSELGIIESPSSANGYQPTELVTKEAAASTLSNLFN